jgi:hypothetical protein
VYVAVRVPVGVRRKVSVRVGGPLSSVGVRVGLADGVGSTAPVPDGSGLGVGLGPAVCVITLVALGVGVGLTSAGDSEGATVPVGDSNAVALGVGVADTSGEGVRSSTVGDGDGVGLIVGSGVSLPGVGVGDAVGTLGVAEGVDVAIGIVVAVGDGAGISRANKATKSGALSTPSPLTSAVRQVLPAKTANSSAAMSV